MIPRACVLMSWRGFGNTLGRTKWFGQDGEGQRRRRVVHDELVEERKKALREEVKYPTASTTTITKYREPGSSQIQSSSGLGNIKQSCDEPLALIQGLLDYVVS